VLPPGVSSLADAGDLKALVGNFFAVGAIARLRSLLRVGAAELSTRDSGRAGKRRLVAHRRRDGDDTRPGRIRWLARSRVSGCPNAGPLNYRQLTSFNKILKRGFSASAYHSSCQTDSPRGCWCPP